jgi:hypothetical protein
METSQGASDVIKLVLLGLIWVIEANYMEKELPHPTLLQTFSHKPTLGFREGRGGWGREMEMERKGEQRRCNPIYTRDYR